MDGLCRHNPIWDQTRSARFEEKGYILVTDDVLLATDFECANGCNIRQSDSDVFEIDLEPEPGEHCYGGLSYYYCFGVASRGAAHRVRVILHNNMGEGEKGLGDSTSHVVVKRGEEWGHLPSENIRSISPEGALELTLDLPSVDDPDSVLFLSDFHWHPYTELAQWVESLRDNSSVRVGSSGTSVSGRDLYRLDLGKEGAPCIVLAQTPQPSEATGTWSCRRIVEFLLSGEPGATSILEQFHIVILPATNPDGTVEGLGLSHPVGRFPYFEGQTTAEESPDALPEMKAVWEVLKQERPWLFLEWHSNNWNRRPGHMLLRYRPSLMEDPDRRRIWEDIDTRLEALPDTHHGNWTSWDEGIYQVSLGFSAVTQLQTISYMIKHHDRFPLAESTGHALQCFLQAVEAGREGVID